MEALTPSMLARARDRREEFMRRIGNSVAIFPSAPVAIRNGDVEHEYRQDTDFYYLSGFEEPHSVLVLAPGSNQSRFVMFVQPKDREREVWTGWRAGVEGALRDYAADAAFTIDELEVKLPELIGKADEIYYRFGSDRTFDERLTGLMSRFHKERQRTGSGPRAVLDPAAILHEMRVVKTDEEQSILRRAVEITCDGHLAALQALRPGLYEYEIEAELEHAFRKRGSSRQGYSAIVASGPNATVLHYTANNRRIEDGDLLLIDAGTEFGYYTGDVTRTYPASGHFTDVQAEVYEVVLEAQLAAIRTVRPGATFIEPHDVAVRVLTTGLVKLGILAGDVDKLIEQEAFRPFYMHRTSHWLGMDVHDAGAYKVPMRIGERLSRAWF